MNEWMNECLTTPQHENRSAIGCQNINEWKKERMNEWMNEEKKERRNVLFNDALEHILITVIWHQIGSKGPLS